MSFNILTVVRLVFLVELLFATAVYALQLKRKKFFVLRLLAGILPALAWALFAPAINTANTFLSILYGVEMFLPIYGFLLFGLWLAFDERFLLILLVSVAGYTTEKIGSLVNSLISLINPDLLNFNGNNLNVFLFLDVILSDGICDILCYFVFGRQMIRNQKALLENRSVLLMSLVAAFTNLLFGIIYSYSDATENISVTATVINYCQNFICCLLVLVIFSGFFQKGEIQRELEHSKIVYSMAKENYKNEKKQAEIINQKCHDLKHRVMEMMPGSNADYSDVLEAINIYDNSVHTNNEALDLVYRQKQLICKKSNITLSTMINAEKMSFMKNTDIFVLFGNLFDNAINAVSKMEEGRFISVKIFEKAGMLLIGFENPYSENLIVENGEYKTTNEHKEGHGYGIKGIKDVVSKYGGTISMTSDNHFFVTQISFVLHS